MCIVIDTNVIPAVFKPSNGDHQDYKPILDWIIDGKGKVIIGGTKYKNEIFGFLSFLAELKRKDKVVTITDEIVNKKEDELIKLINDEKCDDPHIIALLSVSGCKLLCSKDKRSFEFIKVKEFYPNKEIPKIYTGARNKQELIQDKFLIEICKPCKKLTSAEKKTIKILK